MAYIEFDGKLDGDDAAKGFVPFDGKLDAPKSLVAKAEGLINSLTADDAALRTGINGKPRTSAMEPEPPPLSVGMRGNLNTPASEAQAPLVRKDGEKRSYAPLRPEVRSKIENIWDAASPEARAFLEEDQGAVGQVVRQRAEEFEAFPAGQTAADFTDPRAEARSNRLAGDGMDPALAPSWGRTGARRGEAIGSEIGSASKSDFDFEAQKKYNEDPFFNNPLVRAGVKGYENYKVGSYGVNQFIAEVVGADEYARAMAGAAKESTGFTDAIGDAKGNPQRWFEGAVSSIAMQIPALVGGAVTGSQALTLGAMFVQAFGQEYSEGRGKGQTPGEATARASQFASLEIIGEKLGLGQQLAGIKAAAQGNIEAAVVLLTKSAMKQIPGEELTTVGQFLVDKQGSNIGLNTEAGFADLVKQMTDTLAQTLMQGGMMTGGGKLAAKAVNAFDTPERQIARSIDGTNIDNTDIDAIVRAGMDPQSRVRSTVSPQRTTRPHAAPTIPAATIADIQSAPTVDDAIAAAVNVVEQPTTAAPTGLINTDQQAAISALEEQAGLNAITPESINVQPTPAASLPTPNGLIGSTETGTPVLGDATGGRAPDAQPVGERPANPGTIDPVVREDVSGERGGLEQPAALTPVPAQVAPSTLADEIASIRESSPQAPVLQNRNRVTPSSISQMQSISGNPDYGRLGFSRDFANGAPVVAGGQIPEAQLGRTDVAVASDGRRIPMQYAVLEAGDVLASNMADGTPNPEYGDQAIDRIRAIAGNGRIAGLQQAYSKGTTAKYIEEMAADSLHGIEAEIIRGMKSPVLVRVMPMDQVTADIGDVSNTTGNLNLSAVEQANNDAKRINLDALDFAEDGGVTAEVVRQFVRAMPQAEQGGLIDTNGQPTKQAVDRINAAVFASAYGNDQLIRLFAQAQDPEARSILSALAQVAPKMARLEGAEELDIRGLVTEAAEIAVNARRNGIAIKNAAKQTDMAADPMVGVVLDLFADHPRGGKPVVDALSNMADFAYTESNKPAEDMFGPVERASRADVVNQLRPQDERASQENLEQPGGRGLAEENDGRGRAERPAETDVAATEGNAPDNFLTSQSEAEARAEVEAADRREKEAAAEAAAKDDADRRERVRREVESLQGASAENFSLSGEARSDDEVLAGQGSIFDAPPTGIAAEVASIREANTGTSEAETSEIGEAFDDAKTAADDQAIHHLFDAPAKGDVVRLQDKAKFYHAQHGWMTAAQAKAKIAEWKAHAAEQGDNRANSERIVLSLFDLTGKWSQPWEDAGYQVYRYDIQDESMFERENEDTGEIEALKVGDINNFSVQFFSDMYGAFEGNDVYAVLAACPCTDFASSGARHFAAKDADGRTVDSIDLVRQTLATIEYFKPAVWAIENPVGRIEKLGNLPPWRLSFDPNHLGDPYTKKTLLWGRFNADLPIAPVEPTEGSKMHSQYGGKSQKTKNARSATPEGFSYGFFMANNAIDNPVMAITNQWDRLDRALIEEAVSKGITEEQIKDAVEDFYYFDMDDAKANQAIRDLLPTSPAKPQDSTDVMYRSPTGDTWSGKGKPPRWIAGKDYAQFRVNDAPDAAEPASEPAAPVESDSTSPEDVQRRRRAQADVMNALADLGDILNTPFRASITPEQEAKLLPVLTRLMDAAFRLGYLKFKDAAKFALDQIRAALGDEAVKAVTLDHLQGSYIGMAGGRTGADSKRFVIDIEDKAEIEAHTAVAQSTKMVDGVAAIQTTEAGKPSSLAESLYQAIVAGNMPKDNPALKKLVEAHDGQPASQSRMKQGQEILESVIVRVAREIVAKREGPQKTFAVLLRLYEAQPNLNIRTSTSIANQAYSTPAPLAFIGSELAGVTNKTSLYEPTAGNGMLTIGADPKNVTANEMEPGRIRSLKELGLATVIEGDALTANVAPKSQDRVMANPPFGSVKDAAGKPTKITVDGYKIGQIDHLIAARALETMKDDGRAVLIIGANKVAGGLSTDDRIFFNWLYGHYNVTGHFEVDGDLYARQGASWPVRVISINGRVRSETFSPVAGAIQRVDNWSQVYGKYIDILDSSGRPDIGAGARTGGSSGGQANQGLVQGVTDPETTSPDRQIPNRSTGRLGNVTGTRAGTVSDSSESDPITVGASFDEQRLNADPIEPNRLDPAGVTAKPAATRPANTAGADLASAEGNQFQSPYTPRSSRKDQGVLIPANMAQPTQDALSRLEDEVGDIDEFARKELGYTSVEQLHAALMGLQVDSVAMAIYQIQQGKAVVIADQTGIGKGRQAASIIRWAAKQGYTPVFVSVKPSLFTDMYGDLADIGTHDITPFIMNGDAWVAGEGGTKLFANKPGLHKRSLEKIADTGTLPNEANALFMTYSQINVDNVQRRALAALAPNAVFILDESHNAAGASATGEFMVGALAGARGVTYLSATYAKRPDNMPLYFKTDIGDAAADSEGLTAAMAAGGLPLQTVVSNNLVKAGQMFRRERSYDGVSIESKFDTKNRELHERMSNEATKALRAIVAADGLFHEIFVKEMAQELAARGGAVKDNAGNQATAGVQHTEFSSVVHNFVKQMLLGLKAQTAADEAIASINRGEKPIIAVESTMGSFLNEYAAVNNIGQGDSLGAFDYRTVLSRALARTRVLTEKKDTGEEVKRTIPLSMLDPRTRAAYDKAQDVIDSLKLGIPVSPIDWMRAEITRAGHNVAEITGRNLAVDYTDPKNPVLTAIDATEQKDKVSTTRRFNAGNLDALVLNVAGSTGISLHASEKFADQRQRHMIVAQAAGDINIFMQMLGRVHRTGQVKLPKYSILSVDLPTEKRPTAVLSVKMKSLNANTSSNTESATSVKSSDILNKYGDQIVSQYLEDNYALARALGLESEIGGDDPQDDIARKATGRLALQPIETQQSFYDEVEGQYVALIDYLNKTNQNDLEPRTFDFDAQETRKEVLFDGPDKNSPFGEDAIYGEYSIKAQGAPMKPDEIKSVMADALAGQSPTEHVNGLIDGLLEAWAKKFNKDRAKHGLEPGKFDADKYRTFMEGLYDKDAAEAMVNNAIALVAAGQEIQDVTKEDLARTAGVGPGIEFMRRHAVGSMFRVDINSEIYNAVVTNIRSTHKASGSPFSRSKIQVTVAVNGALRSVSVPATQFLKIEVTDIGRGYSIDQLFKEQPDNQRETAKIVTGNLLAAYGELKGVRGTIITFTKADGASEQGILLPKLFDYSRNTQGDYRLKTGADALKFLKTSADRNIDRLGIASRDGIVRVLPSGQGIKIMVPRSKLKGAKYFLDKPLIGAAGDFASAGSLMVANVDAAESAERALDILIKKSALYTTPSMSDEARSILGDPMPKAAVDGGQRDNGEFQDISDPRSSRQQAFVSRAVDRAILRMQGVDVPKLQRESVRITVGKLLDGLDSGKLTADQFAQQMGDLSDRMEQRAADAKYGETKLRERGILYVRERLLQAQRRGDISQEQAKFAEWFLLKNPMLVEKMGISIRSNKNDGVAGNYNPATAVISLFKGSGNDTTAVHEVLHHLERMMPEAMQQEVKEAWFKAIAAELKNADPDMKQYLQNIMAGWMGDKLAAKAASDAIRSGALPYEAYRFLNPSEFWAVNMTTALKDRHDAAESGLWARSVLWLKEALHHIRNALGMASVSPLLRALDSLVKNGDGQFSSKLMLSQSDSYDDIGRAQTSTPAFRKWFGDSKVVDADGNPLVVYHGTHADFSQFDPLKTGVASDAGWYGDGFYFSPDPKEADGYAFKSSGSNVMPAYLSIKNPYDWRSENQRGLTENASQVSLEKRAELEARGFDGVFVYEDMVRLGQDQTLTDEQKAMFSGNDSTTADVFGWDFVENSLRRKEWPFQLIAQIYGYEFARTLPKSTRTLKEIVAFRPTQIKSATGNNGDFDGANPDINFSTAPTFYSALNRALETITKIADKNGMIGAEQARLWLMSRQKEGKFKAEELAWSGLEDYLKLQSGKIAAADIQAFARDNGVQVEEVEKSAPSEDEIQALLDDEVGEGMSREEAIEFLGREEDAPKYGQYQLPGGENYRELLLTLPSKPMPERDAAAQYYAQFMQKGGEPAWADLTPQQQQEVIETMPPQAKAATNQTEYRSGHWDEPNIIAHVRFNERTTADPLTDQQQSDIRKRAEMQRLADALAKKIGMASRDSRIAGDIRREDLLAELRPLVRAGKMTPLEMTRQLDDATFSSATDDVMDMVKERDRLLESMPPEPKQKTYRVLFIEELQSDWGQEGKKKGFRSGRSATEFVAAMEAKYSTKLWSSKLDDAEKAEYEALQSGGVPLAPFVTDTKAWLSLGIKRMIRYAAENGYDKVAFVNGEQSAERYDLSKQVESIEYTRREDGTYHVVVTAQTSGPGLMGGNYSLQEVEDHLGKEIAQKIESGEGEDTFDGDGYKMLSGDGLRVGGEGMKTFYDQIVPQTVNDVLKKLGGGKVEVVEMQTIDGAHVVNTDNGVYELQTGVGDVISTHGSWDAAESAGAMDQVGFTITPEMRDTVMAGQPLFRRNGSVYGMQAAEVERAIAGDTYGHEVDVYQSIDQAPDYIQEQAEREGAIDVEGFWDPRTNRVGLIAGNIRMPDRAKQVARHELIGHYGLENMVGEDAMDKLAKEVIVGERAGNKTLKEVAEQVDRFQPGLPPQRRAREIIAVMAERNIQNSITKRVLDAIRTFLKKIGFIKGDLTDVKISALLRDTQDYLRENGREMVGGESAPAFSSNQTEAQLALQAIATVDAAFRFPKSTSTDIRQIAEENIPGVQVNTLTSIPGETRHNFTFPDGQSARLVVLPFTTGQRLYSFDMVDGERVDESVGRPGRNADRVEDAEDVYIDVSRLSEGSGYGARMYNIAATFAHNNDNIFIGDPAGLSDEAMRRRPEQMLSSALKFGTTAHLAPHPSQIRGDKALGVPPLDWSYGDHISNIQSLIRVNIGSIESGGGAGGIAYNKSNGQFTDANGNPISRADITGMAELGLARSAQAGGATLARYALLKSLLPAESGRGRGGDGRSNGVLESLVEQLRQYDPADSNSPLTRIFYSRDSRVDSDSLGNAQFSRKPSAVWDADEPSKMDDFIYTMQNKHIDTKRAVQAIRESVGSIDENWDPYLKEELFHGRTAKQVSDFLDKELRPLLQDMQARGVKIEEFEDYLHMRHAEERNIQIEKINPNMPDGGSGADTAEARAFLQGLTPKDKAAYEALARRVDAINESTRKILVDSGLEKQSTIDKWEQTYQHYVPLMREEADGGGTGQGFSTRGSSSKRAMGSSRNVIHILANLALQRERTIVRAEKNRVSTALYGLAITAPNPEFWSPVNPATAKKAKRDELIGLGLNPLDVDNFIAEPKQQYIDARTGLVAERINPALRGADNVLATRVNGEDRFVFFNKDDPRAVRMVAAMKNLDADQMGWAMTRAAIGTRYLASINTQYNPIFGIVNLMRDSGEVMFNLSTTPLAGKQAEVSSHILPALRGIYVDVRTIRKGRAATSKWAALFEEFESVGGKTGYRDMYSNSQERADAMTRELKRITEGRLKAAGRSIFDWLSDYNEAMENAVRLSTYKVALDSGLSKEQAASIAKNISVNFNRKGQIGQQAGALYAFFNAAVQGSARMIETLSGPAGKKIIAGGLILGVTQAMLLATAGFDEGEPPDFVKDRNLVIPIGDGKYVTFPMPLGLKLIPNIGRLFTELALRGGKKPEKTALDLLSAILDTFNPIGSAGLSGQTIAPSLADPFVAIWENRDWTGKPIAKEDRSGLAVTPGHTRARDTASSFGKAISYAINWATGGTEYVKGEISPTPDQIDYLIGQATGGVGRETIKAQQSVVGAFTGEEVPAYKIPLVGRFYGNTNEPAAVSSRFYQNLKSLNDHEAELKGRRKDGGDTAGYIKDNPEATLFNLANTVERDVQKLVKQKREMMKKDVSRDIIRLKEQQIAAKMTKFNERVRLAEGKDQR